MLPTSSCSKQPRSKSANIPRITMFHRHQVFVISVASVLISLVHSQSPSKPLLRGVTIRNWPYADRLNDRYEGFVIDLMNKIAEKVNFEYRFYFSPDGKYGTEYNGHINGMIGEVFRNRADFAIADLTVTESRRRYVDFTVPFLENQLAAIIRREDAVGLNTLEDLVKVNDIYNRMESHKSISYGTYRTGSTYYHLAKSRDPIAHRMYSWMLRHPEALVTSAKEGFDRVNAGRYAFVVESTFAEYLSGLYCNLTTLYDTRSLYPRKFAIALPKGSPYLQAFNDAIHELKADGTISRLKSLYWNSECKDKFRPPIVSSSPTVPTEAPPSPQSSASQESNSPVPLSNANEPFVHKIADVELKAVRPTISHKHRYNTNSDNGNGPSLPMPSQLPPLRTGSGSRIMPIEPINIDWDNRNHAQGPNRYHPNTYHYNRRRYPSDYNSINSQTQAGAYSHSVSVHAGTSSSWITMVVSMTVLALATARCR